MKHNATSKPLFSLEQIAQALAAAPTAPVFDPDNPPTRPEDWDEAMVSHSLPELRAQLAKRRRRGPQKTPTKVPTTIRFDADVLAALKATGKGWQTRVNDAMRELLRNTGT